MSRPVNDINQAHYFDPNAASHAEDKHYLLSSKGNRQDAPLPKTCGLFNGVDNQITIPQIATQPSIVVTFYYADLTGNGDVLEVNGVNDKLTSVSGVLTHTGITSGATMVEEVFNTTWNKVTLTIPNHNDVVNIKVGIGAFKFYDLELVGLGHWYLEESEGVKAYDATGNGNTGAITGSVSGDMTNFWYQGNDVPFSYANSVGYSSSFQFITEWDSSIAGLSGVNKIMLPLIASGNYDFIVDWGDGNSDTITSYNQAEATHTYAVGGLYTIRIIGLIEGFQFNAGGDRLKILKVITWGSLKITTSSVFYKCDNLTNVDANDPLDLSLTNSLLRMFKDCKKLVVVNLASWSISTISDVRFMFQNCYLLETLDVSNFDVSNVTSLSLTFSQCRALTTLDVSTWDVSKVTTMSSTFTNCNKLEVLDISNWNTIKNKSLTSTFKDCSSLITLDVSNLDVSLVTDMTNTFRNLVSIVVLDVSNFNTSNITSFNSIFSTSRKIQTLDVSNWDTSKVTNMQAVFNGCLDLTSFDVSGWDVSLVTSAAFFSTSVVLSTQHYDAILDINAGWVSRGVQNSVAIDFGVDSKYSLGTDAELGRDELINNKLWTIIDGGGI